MFLFYYKDTVVEGCSIIYYMHYMGMYQKSIVKVKKSSIQKLQNIQIKAIPFIYVMTQSLIR